ncbi:MAG TPA: DUF892 family protein [Candidatus Paceibacterota bacterium]|nr:DUF892 family protein [Candidatus Paceibacterota bacterium]
MINENLRSLYLIALEQSYSIENILIDELPSMAIEAYDQELKKIFEDHLRETKNQKARLDNLFTQYQQVPGIISMSMQAMVTETETMIKGILDPLVKDAALIASAQKIEHIEIASYHSLLTWAKELKDELATKLLKETLDEEETASKKLTKLSEGGFFSKGLDQKAARK